MQATPAEPRPAPRSRIPPELINMGGTAVGILAVVAAGAGLTQIAPQGVWFTAVSYGLPAAIAFGVYCLVARRIR
jgi:hypothetical protein